MRPSSLKLLRRALAGMIVVMLAAVVHNYTQVWRQRARLVKQAASILDPALIRSAEGLEYSENQNGRVRFKLRARRLAETREGISHLEGIEAFDTSADGGRRNEIRSLRAQYDRDRRRALFLGDVRVSMSGGVELRTESLHYDLAAGVGTSDERVAMSASGARGTARGVRYDRSAETIEFHDAVDLQLVRQVRRPDGAAASETVRARASRGMYARAEARLRLEGGARLESETSELEASTIEATFDADGKRLTGLACRERGRYRSSDPAQSRSVEGDQLRFHVAEAGVLDWIETEGNGRFTADGPDGTDELRGARIRVALDPDRGAPTRLESESGVEFRRRGRSSQVVASGEHLEARFLPGTGQLDTLEIRERARLRSRGLDGEGVGGADELAAGELRMRFRPGAGGASVPAELRASRDVEWTTTAPPPAAPGGGVEQKRSLRADVLEMTYARSGEALESGRAAGHVVLAGVPVGDAERSEIRRLESDQARFSFFPTDNRLRAVGAGGHVAVLFRKPADPKTGRAAQEFRTASTELAATMRDSDGGLATFAQWGGFVYEDASRTARAGRADYTAATEQLNLTDHPEVRDASATTTGERVEYDRRAQVLTVRGNVRSLLRRGGDDGGAVFVPAGKGAGPPAPAVVTADSMQHWSAEGRARYTGNVRLLAEGSQLETAQLDVTESGARAEATGAVRHLIVRSGTPAGPGAGGRSPAPIRVMSARMVYVKADNAAHYSGRAVLTSDDLVLESDSLDAVFTADGRGVQRATARGNVRMRQVGRNVRGDVADYFLDPGRVVVTGNMAQVTDVKRGKSSARRLTLFADSDRILLDND